MIDPLAVLSIIRRIDPDDGVDALAAGVDQRGAGQLHLVDSGQLLAGLHVVALHKGVAVAGDIGILPACAVHRVEADPCTDFRVAVAHDLADVAAAGVQLFDELPGSSVPAAFRWTSAVGGHEALGDIGHILVRLEEGLQVAFELLGRLPCVGKVKLLLFDPAGVYQCGLLRADGQLIAPVQRMACRAGPAVLIGQLEDAALGDGLRAAVEALPFFDALALVIPPAVPGAPLLPHGDGQTGFFQAHAHHEPFFIGQGGRGNEVQRFFDVIFMFHSHYHSNISSAMTGSADGI